MKTPRHNSQAIGVLLAITPNARRIGPTVTCVAELAGLEPHRDSAFLLDPRYQLEKLAEVANFEELELRATTSAAKLFVMSYGAAFEARTMTLHLGYDVDCSVFEMSFNESFLWDELGDLGLQAQRRTFEHFVNLVRRFEKALVAQFAVLTYEDDVDAEEVASWRATSPPDDVVEFSHESVDAFWKMLIERVGAA